MKVIETEARLGLWGVNQIKKKKKKQRLRASSTSYRDYR